MHTPSPGKFFMRNVDIAQIHLPIRVVGKMKTRREIIDVSL